MKKILSAILLFSAMFSNHLSGQNSSFSNADSLAVRKSAHSFEVAFNSHDAKALASLFLPDGEFTNVVGAYVKGRKAIEAFHAPMFEGKPGYFSFKNSTLKNGNTKISVIRPDIASVDVLWSMDKCNLPDGSETTNRRGLVTLLMVKQNGEWGIAIMHNAELPPARNN
jgi:uncharacterized protein (TIGR02246 family)